MLEKGPIRYPTLADDGCLKHDVETLRKPLEGKHTWLFLKTVWRCLTKPKVGPSDPYAQSSLDLTEQYRPVQVYCCSTYNGKETDSIQLSIKR